MVESSLPVPEDNVTMFLAPPETLNEAKLVWPEIILNSLQVTNNPNQLLKSKVILPSARSLLLISRFILFRIAFAFPGRIAFDECNMFSTSIILYTFKVTLPAHKSNPNNQHWLHQAFHLWHHHKGLDSSKVSAKASHAS